MESDERQFLLTTAWMFSRHGQPARARKLFEALIEDDPRDGVSALALAECLLDERDAAGALHALRDAVVPKELDRAAALLETRALSMEGRKAEAARRWSRYVSASKGGKRTWVTT